MERQQKSTESAADASEVISPADHVRRMFAAFGYTRLDGGEVTLPCCNVFRIRDGLVAEYRSYIDATPVYA
jgi:ketosteroid isomerase-like protein